MIKNKAKNESKISYENIKITINQNQFFTKFINLIKHKSYLTHSLD